MPISGEEVKSGLQRVTISSDPAEAANNDDLLSESVILDTGRLHLVFPFFLA